METKPEIFQPLIGKSLVLAEDEEPLPPAGIRRIAGQKSHKVTPILYLYRIYFVWGNNLYIRYLVLHQRPDVVYVNSVADSVVYSIHLLISRSQHPPTHR